MIVTRTKRVALLLVLLLLGSCRIPSEQFQEPSSSPSIFRYAYVHPGLTITLGEKLMNQDGYGVREADRVWRVPVSFPGTSWIRVRTDADDVVRSMYFWYNSGFRFDRELASYTDQFGAPDVKRTDQGEEIHTWNDGWTRFDLVRVDNHHHSVLTDISGQGTAPEYGWAQNPEVPLTLTMDDVLSTTKIWSMIEGVSAELTQSVVEYHPDIHPDTLNVIRDMVDKHYAPDVLFNEVRAEMMKRDDVQRRTALSSWLFGDEYVEIQALVDEYEPELSLEEYANVLGNSTPDEGRIEPMVRVVRASHVGEFFLGIELESIRATTEILRTLPGAEGVPLLPAGDERTKRLEAYGMYGLVSFLWTHEPLTNAQLALLADAFESESGQWYVRVYTDALMSALSNAREQTVHELTSMP